MSKAANTTTQNKNYEKPSKEQLLEIKNAKLLKKVVGPCQFVNSGSQRGYQFNDQSDGDAKNSFVLLTGVTGDTDPSSRSLTCHQAVGIHRFPPNSWVMTPSSQLPSLLQSAKSQTNKVGAYVTTHVQQRMVDEGHYVLKTDEIQPTTREYTDKTRNAMKSCVAVEYPDFKPGDPGEAPGEPNVPPELKVGARDAKFNDFLFNCEGKGQRPGSRQLSVTSIANHSQTWSRERVLAMANSHRHRDFASSGLLEAYEEKQAAEAALTDKEKKAAAKKNKNKKDKKPRPEDLDLNYYLPENLVMLGQMERNMRNDPRIRAYVIDMEIKAGSITETVTDDGHRQRSIGILQGIPDAASARSVFYQYIAGVIPLPLGKELYSKDAEVLPAPDVLQGAPAPNPGADGDAKPDPVI